MKTLSKTLHLSDYDHFGDEMARIGHAKNIFPGLYEFHHEHRNWEYGIALAALGPRDTIPGKKVIDVGGGPSLLGGIVAWGGAQVLVVDVANDRDRQESMGRQALSSVNGAVPGGSFAFSQADILKDDVGQFDVVFCISTIEHTPEPTEFFDGLCRLVAPGGTLVLTTDFHPSGERQITAHTWCFNGDVLNGWATRSGFGAPGGTDYTYHGDYIFYKYSFASLVLRRKA